MENIFDQAIAEKLTNELDRDTVMMILGSFLEECRQRPATMQQAINDKNYDDLMREAHSMKSSAASFGAMKMSKLGEKIEFACRENNFEDARKYFNEVEDVTSETLSALESWKNQKAA